MLEDIYGNRKMQCLWFGLSRYEMLVAYTREVAEKGEMCEFVIWTF